MKNSYYDYVVFYVNELDARGAYIENFFRSVDGWNFWCDLIAAAAKHDPETYSNPAGYDSVCLPLDEAHAFIDRLEEIEEQTTYTDPAFEDSETIDLLPESRPIGYRFSDCNEKPFIYGANN